MEHNVDLGSGFDVYAVYSSVQHNCGMKITIYIIL